MFSHIWAHNTESCNFESYTSDLRVCSCVKKSIFLKISKLAIFVISVIMGMQMIKFHQQWFSIIGALVVAVVENIRNLKTTCNSHDYARTRWTQKQRSGRSQRRRRDENTDDEHGDKDNKDEDDDPQMPAKNDDILDPLELTSFSALFFQMKTGEKEQKNTKEDDENEFDKHGDEDNHDEDDDPKMQPKKRCYF